MEYEWYISWKIFLEHGQWIEPPNCVRKTMAFRASKASGTSHGDGVPFAEQIMGHNGGVVTGFPPQAAACWGFPRRHRGYPSFCWLVSFMENPMKNGWWPRGCSISGNLQLEFILQEVESQITSNGPNKHRTYSGMGTVPCLKLLIPSNTGPNLNPQIGISEPYENGTGESSMLRWSSQSQVASL